MKKGYVDASTIAYKRIITVLVLVAIIIAFPTVFFLADGPEKIRNMINTEIEKQAPQIDFFDNAIIGVSDVAVNIQGEEGKVQVTNIGMIEDIIDINELQACTFHYNAICTVNKNNDSNTRYFVAYDGDVTLGIDISKVKIDYGNNDDKVITITIPGVEIQKTVVNPGTMEFIFENSKDNTPEVHMEAYKKCEEDLFSKVSADSKIFDLAYSNAETEVRAFTTPLVEQFYPDYTLKIVKEGA